MTQAWMKRGAERQDEMEKLIRLIRSKEEEVGKNLEVDLAKMILEYLRDPSGFIAIALGGGVEPERDVFAKVAIHLANFARGDAEFHAMMAEILTRLVQSITGGYHAELTKAEMVNPRKFFDADSAMSEVKP